MIGAILMVGGEDDLTLSAPEALMLAAWQAATRDLIALLHAAEIAPIIVSAPDTAWLTAQENIIRIDDPPNQPFHFGERLAALIHDHELDTVLYFGGGSAPLLTVDTLHHLLTLLHPADISANQRIVVTNNLHSSDWALIREANAALPILRMCHRDNSIAWLLREHGGYDVRVFAETGLDIDTPADLALLRYATPSEQLRAVWANPLLDAIPVRQVRDLLLQGSQSSSVQTPKTIALIGRVGPNAWQELNKAVQMWTRVIAEERGMVAAERVERGEVRSILLPMIQARGFEGFFADLASMADAALFDDRVLFAAQGVHPTAADRFASDLFMAEAVHDPFVRAFTRAAANAPIPVILGGHSVVAGGLSLLAASLRKRTYF